MPLTSPISTFSLFLILLLITTLLLSFSHLSLSLPLWQKDIMDKVLIVYLTPLARDLLGPQYTVYLLHAWILFTRWERPMAATPTQKNKWLRPIHSEATNLIFLCYFVKLQALKQNFQKVNFTFNNFFFLTFILKSARFG